MRTELRVGVFVIVGLCAVGLIIFVIGDARRMFETKELYTASFRDVQGLTKGSPVRMGGLDIGRVKRVSYASDEKDDSITVSLAVVGKESRRIRMDSVARIEPRGLLGDKMITISVGDTSLPVLPREQPIPSGPDDGIMSQLSSMSEKAEAVVGNLEKATGTLAEEEFRKDVSNSAAEVRRLLEGFNQGDGYVPRLLHDKAEAEKLSQTLTNLQRVSVDLQKVLRGLDTAIGRVNAGPGMAHEVIYGETGTEAVASIGKAADELALTLRGIREGDGVVGQMLFGGGDNESTKKVVADLTAITSDLRVMVRQVREGKGTLGALMVDPSVYEDLKVLLGNVQRNEVLRALVRYSIKKDQPSPRVQQSAAP